MRLESRLVEVILAVSFLLLALVLIGGCREYDTLSTNLIKLLDGPGGPLPDEMVVRVDEIVAYDKDARRVTVMMISDCGGPGSVFGGPRAWETHYEVRNNGMPFYELDEEGKRIGKPVRFYPLGTAPTPASSSEPFSGRPPKWDQIAGGLLRVSKNWGDHVLGGIVEYDGCDRATAYIANEWGKAVWLNAIGGFMLTELVAGVTAKVIVNTILPPPSSWAVDYLRTQVVKWAAEEVIDYLRNRGEVRCDSLAMSIGDMRDLKVAGQVPVDDRICQRSVPSPTPPPPSPTPERVAENRIAYIGPNTDLYIANSDGSDQRIISDRSTENFEWSPDGQKILFNPMSYDEGPGIFLLNLETEEERRILPEGFFLEWSPDSNQLIYWLGGYPTTPTLTIFDLETETSRSLPVKNTGKPMVSIGPTAWAWNPDGKRIAYIDDYVDEHDMRGKAIWVINTETLQKVTIHRVTLGSVGKPYFLSWSPDGDKIGYASILIRQGVGLLTFDVLDLASGAHEDTFEIGYDPFCGFHYVGMLRKLMDVHWADGNAQVALSYSSYCEMFTPGTWLFEHGKEPRYISELVGGNGIDISPDGASIVIGAGPQLYVIDIDGTNLKQISAMGHDPAWQPSWN